MRALEKLQSSNAVLAVLVLALLAQMPHAQHVFFNRGSDAGWFGWVQSWFGAVALEFAVLVFVVRGKTLESWGFALFSVAINLVYYHSPEIAWYTPRATWLLAAGLPVAIALYSHEVAGKHVATVYTTVATDVNRDVATVDIPVADVNFELLPLSTAVDGNVDGELTPVDVPVAVGNWPVAAVDSEVAMPTVAQLADQLLQRHGGDRATVAAELSNKGFKGVDISSALGVHKTQVSRWLSKKG